jgi:hypothetical protein
MHTIDTSVVISKALERLKAYPAGSVSKREVVASIPCDAPDMDKLAWNLNGKLTKAIYSYWQQAALDKPQAHTRSRDELTKLAQETADSLRTAEAT